MHICAVPWALFGVLALSTGVAHANLAAPEIEAARRALHEYDVYGDDTTRVLTELTRFIPEAAEEMDRHEARFLRAAVATDLLLIGAGSAHPGLRGRVSEALGVPTPGLVAFLETELRAIDAGVYHDAAGEALWVLDAITHDEIEPHSLYEGRGERRDVLYVRAVVDALGRDDSVDRLGALGADPCEGAAPCAYAAFAPGGRRAIGALAEASAALGRLARIAADGEPLIQALAASVATDAAILQTSAIHPTPALPDDLHVPEIGSRGASAHPELLLVVTERELRYTYVPSVRVGSGGVEMVAPATPVLPAWGRLPLRDDHRTAVAPYDDLVERLRPIHTAHPVDSVALAAAGDMDSHRVSRVFVSLRRAGIPTPSIVSRGAQGEARSLAITLIMGEESSRPLSLFVRLGGYTLHRHRASLDIPRVRDDAGLHFDVATLEARASASARLPAALRYMSGVPWGTVLDAAFRLRPEPAPLSLVLY